MTRLVRLLLPLIGLTAAVGLVAVGARFAPSPAPDSPPGTAPPEPAPDPVPAAERLRGNDLTNEYLRLTDEMERLEGQARSADDPSAAAARLAADPTYRGLAVRRASVAAEFDRLRRRYGDAWDNGGR